MSVTIIRWDAIITWYFLLQKPSNPITWTQMQALFECPTNSSLIYFSIKYKDSFSYFYKFYHLWKVISGVMEKGYMLLFPWKLCTQNGKLYFLDLKLSTVWLLWKPLHIILLLPSDSLLMGLVCSNYLDMIFLPMSTKYMRKTLSCKYRWQSILYTSIKSLWSIH